MKNRTVEKFISEEMHSIIFFEEFSFSNNQFTTPKSEEFELADAVVMLGKDLLVYQIKERKAPNNASQETEKQWFERKVLGKAVKQIRDTIEYLNRYEEINVENHRGHIFNIASRNFRKVIKVIIYVPSDKIPKDCLSVRYYKSKNCDFIHIVNARDYIEISRALRVPSEIVEYFNYRENAIINFDIDSHDIVEASLVGHFIGCDHSTPPKPASAIWRQRLIQDQDTWDLGPFLRRLKENFEIESNAADYYDILREFAYLPRSAWREVHLRFRLCIDIINESREELPYRISFPDRSCGFVFIPMLPEISQDDNYKTILMNAAKNFTYAHKYEQRLKKCVGVVFSKYKAYIDIYWCLLSSDWQEDDEMEKNLRENFPFRPVSTKRIYGYLFSPEEIGTPAEK